MRVLAGGHVTEILVGKTDQATKDADIARRRGLFEAALKKMKQIAEQ